MCRSTGGVCSAEKYIKAGFLLIAPREGAQIRLFGGDMYVPLLKRRLIIMFFMTFLCLSRGVVFMSGIYFALIRAKNYAAALITHSFCCIPERTDSFWPIKVSCVSILKHGHGFYYRVPMFSAFLRRKQTSARTKMSSQLWYRLDMWCTRIPNQ